MSLGTLHGFDPEPDYPEAWGYFCRTLGVLATKSLWSAWGAAWTRRRGRRRRPQDEREPDH